MSIQTWWEEKGLYVKISGVSTDDNITCAYRELYSDHERFLSSNFILWDFSDAIGVESLPIEADIYAIECVNVAFEKEEFQCAIVVTHVVILSRVKQYIDMSVKLKSSWKFGVFSSIKDARKWVTN